MTRATNPQEQYNGFEQGPIRPPSEAGSLLIRITRNCPWNRCTFCSMYKGKRFELRSVEEIIDDINTVAGIRDELEDVMEQDGRGRRVTREAVIDLLQHPESVTGLQFTYEPESLRFFQARFRPKS